MRKNHLALDYAILYLYHRDFGISMLLLFLDHSLLVGNDSALNILIGPIIYLIQLKAQKRKLHARSLIPLTNLSKYYAVPKTFPTSIKVFMHPYFCLNSRHRLPSRLHFPYSSTIKSLYNPALYFCLLLYVSSFMLMVLLYLMSVPFLVLS